MGPLTLGAYLEAIGAAQRPPAVTSQVSVSNRGSEPLEVFLEPWGNHIFLDPGVDYVVVSHNPTADAMQPNLRIEWTTSGLTIWAMTTGSTLEVFREGVQVDW
jgi:hypothetical protein